MLRKVRDFWISGVLEQSLHGAALLTLGLHERRDAVANPWHLVLHQLEQAAAPLPLGTSISQAYDAVDGELLILGEPGSGKTTLLLELARTLLDRATGDETHPIPVVFNLSCWAQKQRSLSDWLVEELHSKYQVPRKLAQFWVQTEQILPLLDGLDEVTTSARSACIETINSYRQQHGLLSLVVCCRQADYFAQSTRLLLRRAVIVQPLSAEQIETYLASGGEQLTVLRHTLQTDPVLSDLASNPLMLSVLTLTYYGKSVKALSVISSAEARRREVFATYVGRMLKYRGNQSRYTPQQTLHWLAWLARQLVRQQQTEFYMESMQPQWLSDRRSVQWYCRLIVALLAGLVGGATALFADIPVYQVIYARFFAIFMHPVGTCAYQAMGSSMAAHLFFLLLPLPLVGLLYGLGSGILGWLLGGLIGYGQPQQESVETRFWSGSASRRRVIAALLGVGFGLIFLLINHFWVPCRHDPQVELYYGSVALFVGGLIGGLLGGGVTHIQPIEALVWSRVSLRRRILVALLGGTLGILAQGATALTYEVYLKVPVWQSHLLASGCIGWLFGAVIGWWLSGFSHQIVDERISLRPNEGIRRSVRNGLIIGLPIGLAFSGVTFGFSSWMNSVTVLELAWSIPLSLIITVVLVLLNGGYACLQHMVLRFVLVYQRHIPWNYERFLDEASERLLLRKVGGGYIFVHRLLLEYLASLPTANKNL
jgi:DNA polymerase III delta prime subunit